jgi:hypothetical protein
MYPDTSLVDAQYVGQVEADNFHLRNMLAQQQMHYDVLYNTKSIHLHLFTFQTPIIFDNSAFRQNYQYIKAIYRWKVTVT